MINEAVKRRNRNMGSNISIDQYIKLLTEKSFKLLLIEHYDDIFNELTKDIDSINKNLEGIRLKDIHS